MNNGYNSSMYQMPAAIVCQESLCQQSMYHQQRTIVDRSRMAVTDVYVQEQHVSQNSWAMTQHQTHVRPPFFLPGGGGRGPYAGNNPMGSSTPQTQGRFPYMPVPGNYQYYASGSTSMNSYGFMQQSSGSYMTPHHSNSFRGQQMSKEIACQTLETKKRSCDAATQTDLIGDAPPMPKLNLNDSCQDGTEIKSIYQGDRRNSEVTLPKQRLVDMIRISLEGSDIAERLANTHCQRPCFKKMDTLCARLKQDLLRPDGVLPNINSQGIAWAVKDFIFVFTRIVNSWVILKGYAYNTPDGLNKIKDELPDGFMGAFDCWQMSTLTLVNMIIKSFVNLDSMLQKQKNSFTRPDVNSWSSNGNSSDSSSSNITFNGTDSLPASGGGCGPNAYSTPQQNVLGSSAMGTSFTDQQEKLDNKPVNGKDLNYLYTMVQDSEEAQRCVNANGTYLKTGTYTPLKKDENLVEQLPEIIPLRNVMNISSLSSSQSTPEQRKPGLKTSTPKLKAQCRHNDVKPYVTPMSLMGREMAAKLFELSKRILHLHNIDRFFQKQFTMNYFPYFYERCQHEFIDIRAIILKCESATYQHVNQAIHDLRRIIFLVRKDLKDHTNMELRLYTALYERSITDMLSKPPYQVHLFLHITGRPGENIFFADF